MKVRYRVLHELFWKSFGIRTVLVFLVLCFIFVWGCYSMNTEEKGIDLRKRSSTFRIAEDKIGECVIRSHRKGVDTLVIGDTIITNWGDFGNFIKTLNDESFTDGIVLIDDYHFYAGCALAIHEYLGKNKLSYRIYNINDLAYFYKTNASVLIEENLRLLEI